MRNFEKFKEKLKILPLKPGTYLMKDKRGHIIYVGKAKVIKNRVSQYFHSFESHSARTQSMISKIWDFDYIITDTEVEALLLESNMIKEHKPKYNILLKDDKNYSYIKATVNEDYPRILLTKKILPDGSRYFGPFLSSFVALNTVELIRKTFHIRTCQGAIKKQNRTRPCLYYYLNHCLAPCANKISKEEYFKNFHKACLALDGQTKEVTKELNLKMQLSVKNLDFETALKYRDKLSFVQSLGKKQKMSLTHEENRDIIGLFKDFKGLCIQVFYMRKGKIIGSEYFVFNKENSEEEVLSSFIKQFYSASLMIPDEIFIPFKIDDLDNIEELIKNQKGSSVKLVVPKKGKKAELVKIVSKNAQFSMQKFSKILY